MIGFEIFEKPLNCVSLPIMLLSIAIADKYKVWETSDAKK